MKKTKRRLNVAFVFLALAIFAGGGWFLYQSNRPTAEVYQARIGKAVAAVYGTVKIEWLWSVNVRAQNTGYIHFAEGIQAGQRSIGTMVQKGQVLATIQDEETSRQIKQAKLDLQAVVDRREIGAPSAQLLKTAQDKLERLMKLKELNNVPAAELEKARNEVQRIENVVANELIELDRIVETQKQSLKALLKRLSKSEIRAPIDGVLTQIHNVDGELVFENDTLFTVAQNETYVLGQVNEEDVGDLKNGMKAKIRLYSFPHTAFDATLTSILPAGDTSTNRYSVVLNLDNPPKNLMAGMTGEMNIILAERDNALLIPARALVGKKVFLVDNGVVTPREVELGYQSIETAEVLSGITEGDRVIVADQDIFSPGERVQTVVVNSPD